MWVSVWRLHESSLSQAVAPSCSVKPLCPCPARSLIGEKNSLGWLPILLGRNFLSFRINKYKSLNACVFGYSISVYAGICVCLCLCKPSILRDFKEAKRFAVHLQNVVYEQSVLVIQHFLYTFLAAVSRSDWLEVVWQSCSQDRFTLGARKLQLRWHFTSQCFSSKWLDFCNSYSSSDCH